MNVSIGTSIYKWWFSRWNTHSFAKNTRCRLCYINHIKDILKWKKKVATYVFHFGCVALQVVLISKNDFFSCYCILATLLQTLRQVWWHNIIFQSHKLKINGHRVRDADMMHKRPMMPSIFTVASFSAFSSLLKLFLFFCFFLLDVIRY